ncbi:MAG: serine/threonine-protein kinase [Polyangiales bacterium]
MTQDESPDAEHAGFEADLLVGRLIDGRYRIDEVLDRGGVAIVYRAEHEELSRAVAVKLLQEELGEHEEELRGRFEREARALAALQHPHVVHLIDYGVTENHPYLVMELLQGRSLQTLLLDRETLTPQRAFAITRQVLQALAHAHDEGLLHRDLKPGNVFLQELAAGEEHVKLLDFGFAKFFEGDTSRDGPLLTRTGIAFGTPPYMAPEQATGGAMDARVDLYSAAVLLYEMLCGRRPFEGTAPEILRAKLSEKPPPLGTFVSGDRRVRPELEALLSRALAWRKEERFSSAGEMIAALDAVPQPAVTEDGTGTETEVARSPRVGLLGGIAAAGLAALACLGTGAWWLLGGEQSSASSASQPSEPSPTSAPETLDRSVAELPVPDPWEARDPPPLLHDIHTDVMAGETVGKNALRELRSYSSAAPEDPLPHLLVAHVYVQRGWRSDALEHYSRAHELDEDIRGDPRMLVNLVLMAGHPAVGRRASDLVSDVYGGEALPIVDEALARGTLEEGRAERLRRLRTRLR